MDILRFLTAGSVDDGKSTLIGRLLYDSKNILIDQLEALEQSSKKLKDGGVDLALLTDGLRAEREQGITIDVAYKYFSTPNRKFIIADAPGHIQYTRNMVTGASNVDLAVILIDARNGIIEQTKRHSIICSLLQIPFIVIAVNKMDLINHSQERYDEIVDEFKKLAEVVGITSEVSFIPISALNGDNIVDRSANMNWYEGPTMMELLETVEVQESVNLENARMPIQYVLRPQTEENPDYRGYAGKIESGKFKKGDKITIYPSGVKATIAAVECNNQIVDEVFAPQSTVIHLEEDVDASRGDIIVIQDDILKVERDIEAVIAWMDEKPLTLGGRYLLQQNSRVTDVIVTEFIQKIDVNTLGKHSGVSSIGLNELVLVRLKTAVPLAYDSYSKLRNTGGAILIDKTSYTTVAAILFK
ncbi:MAG: GTP-binding protein [Dysgonamonadaceae bacterium]